MQDDVDVKKLRVGNILFSLGGYYRVTFNDENGYFRVADFDNPNSIPSPSRKMEAIFIDDEILKQCGFSQQSDPGLWHTPGFFVHQCGKGWVRWQDRNFYSDRIANYLHDLQNLYFDTVRRDLVFTPKYKAY
jgi:hypothetical protein